MRSKTLDILNATFSVDNLVKVVFVSMFTYAFVGFDSIMRTVLAVSVLTIALLISQEMGDTKAHNRHMKTLHELNANLEKFRDYSIQMRGEMTDVAEKEKTKDD